MSERTTYRTRTRRQDIRGHRNPMLGVNSLRVGMTIRAEGLDVVISQVGQDREGTIIVTGDFGGRFTFTPGTRVELVTKF